MRKYQCIFQKIFPVIQAEAHCDIPCGIYDLTPAKIAAMTAFKMVQQLLELKPSSHHDEVSTDVDYFNAVARRIRTKEKHANLCKQELYILWSDFFKPEHLKEFPNLHEMFWNATKLCSRVKQGVVIEDAKALVAAVDEIAKMFYAAKKDSARFESYKNITDKVF